MTGMGAPARTARIGVDVGGTLLVGISGTLATRRVVNTPPIVTLRED